jgi:sugar/nucleoside kinase (ribokinase family)
MLTPNESEALELTGCAGAEEAARRLSALSGRAAVVTLGEAGCVVAEGGRLTRVAAAPVETIVDSVGAGDAFAGGLAAALSRGEALEEAVAAALRTAAKSLGHAGARPSSGSRDG